MMVDIYGRIRTAICFLLSSQHTDRHRKHPHRPHHQPATNKNTTQQQTTTTTTHHTPPATHIITSLGVKSFSFVIVVSGWYSRYSVFFSSEKTQKKKTQKKIVCVCGAKLNTCIKKWQSVLVVGGGKGFLKAGSAPDFAEQGAIVAHMRHFYSFNIKHSYFSIINKEAF
jgi:hypothetical protein